MVVAAVALVRIRAIIMRAMNSSEFVRVLLADTNAEIVSGGGSVTRLGAVVREQRECDVLVDAKMPLIAAIVDWAERTCDMDLGQEGEDEARSIVFDTTNAAYFKTVKLLLSERGFVVLDKKVGHPGEAVSGNGHDKQQPRDLGQSKP